MSVRFMMLLCCMVLTGDTASRTSLPGGDDDSLVDDGTSSRWIAEQYNVGHKKFKKPSPHIMLFLLYFHMFDCTGNIAP